MLSLLQHISRLCSEGNGRLLCSSCSTVLRRGHQLGNKSIPERLLTPHSTPVVSHRTCRQFHAIENVIKNVYDNAPHHVDSVGGCWRWYIWRCYVSRKDYKFPEVREEDLDEKFIRGSGPGGQATNKTSNCVSLKHLPTGIVIKCHATRSLDINRQRARKLMQERLDVHINGEQSFLVTQKKENSQRKADSKRRNKQRLEIKKAFKELD